MERSSATFNQRYHAMLNNVMIGDAEVSVKRFEDGKIDNSPFEPTNRMVSFHWILNSKYDEVIFYHDEQVKPDDRQILQDAFDQSEMLVCHNAKFDVIWLLELGFRLPKKIYCTMIGEYILARGLPVKKSLKETATRRGGVQKKSDLVDDMFKSGTGFESMPLDVVREYAKADVYSCRDIYVGQVEDLTKEENKGLKPTFDLMMDMMQFIVEITRNGMKIDLDELDRVEQLYSKEKRDIEERLRQIVVEVMGDTPCNLHSGADVCAVIYSRRVRDKEKHVSTFNIGTGANGKPLYPPRMSNSQFVSAVRNTTSVVYKTIARRCSTCEGVGSVHKTKKDGTPFKNRNKCRVCNGQGAIYVPTNKVGGLKLLPMSPRDASVHGFKTDKHTLNSLIPQAQRKGNNIAVEFLQKTSRLNALSTYLDSFIKGIKTWVKPDGILHPEFSQVTTATGRLSSQNPNFQNIPKRGNFELRKALVSRFENGSLLEADFSGLEWRVAADLSRCKTAMDDIINGKDIHRQTASIVYQKPMDKVTSEERTKSKAISFSPLYGAKGNNAEPHIKRYYDDFYQIYTGIKRWHKELTDTVLKTTLVTTPSGREFSFPKVKRLRNGGVTGHTKILNFPCQSFATADLVPLACYRAYTKFKEENLKSKLVLTVHDSIVVDVYPTEIDKVKEILTWAMSGLDEELVNRFKYQFALPLDIEMSIGKNWMEQNEIK